MPNGTIFWLVVLSLITVTLGRVGKSSIGQDTETTVPPNSTSSTDFVVLVSNMETYNGTEVALEIHHSHSEEEKLGTFIELAIFLGVGIFGNCLLLAVFSDKVRSSKRQQLRSFSNHTILALAVGDLALLLFAVPTILANIYRIIESDVTCSVLQFLTNFLTLTVHLIMTVAVPLERMAAICFGRDKLLTLQRTVVLFVAIVAVSAGVASPLLVQTKILRSEGFSPNCVIEKSYLFLFGLTNMIVGGLSLLFAVICYVKILVEIWRVKQCLSQHSDSQQPISAREFARMTSVVWMMFVITAVYLLTWLPFFLYQLGFLPSDYRYRLIYLLNNATNFLVFGAMSPRLRGDMWRKLTCGFCGKSSLGPSSTVRVTTSTDPSKSPKYSRSIVNGVCASIKMSPIGSQLTPGGSITSFDSQDSERTSRTKGNSCKKMVSMAGLSHNESVRTNQQTRF